MSIDLNLSTARAKATLNGPASGGAGGRDSAALATLPGRLTLWASLTFCAG